MCGDIDNSQYKYITAYLQQADEIHDAGVTHGDLLHLQLAKNALVEQILRAENLKARAILGRVRGLPEHNCRKEANTFTGA